MACETIGWVGIPVRFLRFFSKSKKTWLFTFFLSCLTRFLEHWVRKAIDVINVFTATFFLFKSRFVRFLRFYLFPRFHLKQNVVKCKVLCRNPAKNTRRGCLSGDFYWFWFVTKPVVYRSFVVNVDQRYRLTAYHCFARVCLAVYLLVYLSYAVLRMNGTVSPKMHQLWNGRARN